MVFGEVADDLKERQRDLKHTFVTNRQDLQRVAGTFTNFTVEQTSTVEVSLLSHVDCG